MPLHQHCPQSYLPFFHLSHKNVCSSDTALSLSILQGKKERGKKLLLFTLPHHFGKHVQGERLSNGSSTAAAATCTTATVQPALTQPSGLTSKKSHLNNYVHEKMPICILQGQMSFDFTNLRGLLHHMDTYAMNHPSLSLTYTLDVHLQIPISLFWNKWIALRYRHLPELLESPKTELVRWGLGIEVFGALSLLVWFLRETTGVCPNWVNYLNGRYNHNWISHKLLSLRTARHWTLWWLLNCLSHFSSGN